MKARIVYSYQEKYAESDRCVAAITIFHDFRQFAATASTWEAARKKVIQMAREYLNVPKSEEVDLA